MYWTKYGTALFAIGFIIFFFGIVVMLSVWQEHDNCEFASYRSENVVECQKVNLGHGFGLSTMFSGVILFSIGFIMVGIGRYKDNITDTNCPRCGFKIEHGLLIKDCPKCGLHIPRSTK